MDSHIALVLDLTLIHRFTKAVSTLPGIADWLQCAALLLGFGLIAVPVGFKSGFLQFDPQELVVSIKVISITLFAPAIVEELGFRVLLLPHLSEYPSFIAQWLWGSFGVLLFVVYHPLNAWTFYPAGRKTFIDPMFLCLAALLGMICTLSYWQSGSLWTSTLIHWLIVAVWLLILGGYRRLHDRHP